MSEAPKQSEALVPKAQSDLMKPEAQAGKLSRLAAFTPQTLTEAIALSKLIANSELAPKDFKGKPANVLIAMQMGAEVGLAPMAALQNIAVINGRPSIWGDAALGIVMVHPEYEWHKESLTGENLTMVAQFTIKRMGQEPYVTQFSVADAQKSKLWGKEGPWQTYPKRMLQMRARGFGIRDKFPDALRGLNLAEEAMDIPADTSPAKARREEGTFDVAAAVSDLAPSAEANRGHQDTGLERKPDEQNQPEPKKEPVICADCGKVDGHEETCKYFAKAEQDRRTSKPTIKILYQILTVEQRHKTKKDDKGKKTRGEPYLVMNVLTLDDKQGKVYVWRKSFFEYFPLGDLDKKIVAEVSEQEKDGKKFAQLEHIIELGGVPFVDDKPAEQGSLLPTDTAEDEEWEEKESS
jgi:hypothetical protein